MNMTKPTRRNQETLKKQEKTTTPKNSPYDGGGDVDVVEVDVTVW